MKDVIWQEGQPRGFLNGSKRELLLEYENVRGSAELQCFLSRMCLPVGCGNRIVWKIQKFSKTRDWLEISHYFEQISEVNLEETNLTSVLQERTSLVAQMAKCLPITWDIGIRCLGWEDPLQKEMATHSSILAWRIPQMEKPGRLHPRGCKESDTTKPLLFLSVGKGRVNTALPHTLTPGHSPTPCRARDPKAGVTWSFKAMEIRQKAQSASCFSLCFTMCFHCREVVSSQLGLPKCTFFMSQKRVDIVCLIPSPYFKSCQKTCLVTQRKALHQSEEFGEGFCFSCVCLRWKTISALIALIILRSHAHIHLH